MLSRVCLSKCPCISQSINFKSRIKVIHITIVIVMGSEPPLFPEISLKSQEKLAWTPLPSLFFGAEPLFFGLNPTFSKTLDPPMLIIHVSCSMYVIWLSLLVKHWIVTYWKMILSVCKLICWRPLFRKKTFMLIDITYTHSQRCKEYESNFLSR